MPQRQADQPIHAGLVATRRDGRWVGVLIEGSSGVGKSDLALRALDTGFRLVADDRVILWASGGRLFGRAPASLAGLAELRGVGVVSVPFLALCEVVLIVRCALTAEIERMPEPLTASHAGIPLPVVALCPFEPSAPAKMRRAIDHLGARP